ncbi:MAG: TetR/AcrR family transcriptional regulator [Candidatus Binatia bacterium]
MTTEPDAREKILETATRLFSGQGYASTSLSHVAKEANVSKALIFWHFESKEKLFRAALQRTLEPYFINVVDALDGISEVEQMFKLIDLYYQFVHDHLESIRFILGLIIREERSPEDAVARIGELFRIYRNLLGDILEGARQKGLIRADADPKTEAASIMAALNGVLVQRFLDASTDGVDDLLAHLKRTLTERLRPVA